MSKNRRPILYKGERLATPVEKPSMGFTKQPEISFDEARTNLLSNINTTISDIEKISSKNKLPNESVVCVRMHHDFTAKSYYPQAIFNQEGLTEIGSRMWREKKNDKTVNSGKMFFLRVEQDALSYLKNRLNQSVSRHTQAFMLSVRRLSGLGLLDEKDQILGFNNNWNEGMIEAVIHPFNIDKDLVVSHFINTLRETGVKDNSIKWKQYGGGVTFLSVFGNKQTLDAIRGYNPLRTAHPLEGRNLIDFARGTDVVGCPLPPVFKKKSKIVVGILDGGFDSTNAFLNNYVVSEDCVVGASTKPGINHGTLVTGAALYGPLNDYKDNVVLPEPAISAKNFRVLSKETRHEMYDSIDAIESIVPKNPEINVYNVSFGPRHPILDDSINRFTYSLDLLSDKYNVLFCVAVGNDGDQIGYDRIQSPSDMVNGLAVGSYTLNRGKKERSDYSCVGPGREGSKLKPDVVAFGGCSRTPIQLFSEVAGSRSYTRGTSFSSPIVAGAAAQLIGGSKNIIDSLVAKALIIHTAEEKKEKHCKEIGHGTLPEDISNIVSCQEKTFTLIYNGEILPKSFAKFEIPWVQGITGKVKFSWTLAVMTGVNESSPDDYTNTMIELTFYPNSKKFRFKKPAHIKDPKIKDVNLHLEKDATKIAKLLKEGWVQSDYPLTSSNSASSPSKFLKESELRADLKWDTTDHRVNKKVATGVDNPFFIVHAMARGKNADKQKVKYALILTIEAPKSKIDIYEKVLNKYTALAPVSVDIKTNVVVS
jgi:hypothetical protein